MQASKWIKIGVLADAEELKKLFCNSSANLFPFGKLVDAPHVPVTSEQFLEEYGLWMAALQRGELPTDASLKRLPLAWTLEEGAMSFRMVASGRFLVSLERPVVQIQAHFFRYSPLDGSIRSMVLSQDAIFWGLQFSYPQIYQEPETMNIVSTRDFPNMSLFQKVRSWVRDATLPTPFQISSRSFSSPIRIGKRAMSWIQNHPQLATSALTIQGGS